MGEKTKVPATQPTPATPKTPANTTLSSSGQRLDPSKVQTTKGRELVGLKPVHLSDGKVSFNLPGGKGNAPAELVGFIEGEGLVFSTALSNESKFIFSKQPAKDRSRSAATDNVTQMIRNDDDKHTIILKDPDLLAKIQAGQAISSKDINNSIRSIASGKGKGRILMHVRNKTEQAQAVAEQAAKQKESWWDKHKWKVIIGVLVALALTTIGILGFRKGGWWNKRKKGGNSSPTTVAPGPTTPTPFIPHDTEPGPTTTPPLNSQVPTTPVQSTTVPPTVPGQNITGGDNDSSGNNSANATKPPLING